MMNNYESEIQSTVDVSNTNISNYSLISKNMVETYFLFLFVFQLLLSQTTDISVQKFYFEISAV